jgi:hypothetical protein
MPTDTPHIEPVRAARSAAREIAPRAVHPPVELVDAGDHGPRDLPEGCPVIPLGVSGGSFHYLDTLGQHRTLEDGEHGRLKIQGLFMGQIEFLYNNWPVLNKDGQVTRWKAEIVSERLMNACARRGVYDPFERVRGYGAWLGEDNELILHCGDAVWREGHGWQIPGTIGRYVYPAAPTKPQPYGLDGTLARVQASGLEVAAARPLYVETVDRLVTLLRTWNWSRPAIDPHLLLGWIGAAMLGGALKWRVLAWITGDKGTGKSTLQDVLKHLFDGELMSVQDATAAGIWQVIGHASAPIAIDELEPEEDNRRAAQIIKLARLASSGATMPRGGADHQGVQFTLRSCFLFSSILRCPLNSAEISRMALLELGQLEGSTPPKIAPRELRAIGGVLRRRLVEQWPRFAPTLEAYRVALAKHGHVGRGADQFGTLLACADMLLHDCAGAPPADAVEEWAERLKASGLAERALDVADHDKCVAHLLSSSVESLRGGERKAIASLIETAVDEEWYRTVKGPWELRNEAGVEANRLLGTVGIKVVRLADPVKPDDIALSTLALDVACSHRKTADLFGGTHWAGRSGAAAVYIQALRRVPGAADVGTRKFNGFPSRAIRLPLDQLIPDPDTD